ncbi:DUF2637 domain-containing protein [Nonomuraea roseoviolacea]|uniref:DUF2637 domain-containing protein n=1 Tax=Nonomuraea roseoviolacea subsp. carminata TaxID=160689 RepID=A0ABT1JQH0_9ACTN|nr:DUF2637 domain-containing protein [Nonomuraea roseoviolacea]MCP2343970.1 hypothetical protein [Nonomuraea roseoviolacea subsp. carminata]
MTVVMVLIAILTFTFSFGNVWHLATLLGVPAWIAPLVGPAVDLSVIGLLLGIHYVRLHSPNPIGLGPARTLLTFSGLATLGLNVAAPMAQGEYGRAAIDAVAPLLLIGWSEVGPGLLRQISTTRNQDLVARGGATALKITSDIEAEIAPTPQHPREAAASNEEQEFEKLRERGGSPTPSISSPRRRFAGKGARRFTSASHAQGPDP